MNKLTDIAKRAALIVLAFIVAIIITLIIARFLKTPQDVWLNVPLPDTSKQLLVLRVAYANNPRFTALTEPQLQQLLQQTTLLMQQHFQLNVEFKMSAPITVDALFSVLPAAVKQQRASSIADPRTLDQHSIGQMRNSLYDQLSHYAGDSNHLLDYARPHVVSAETVTDIATLARALTDTHIARLVYWYDEKSSDGEPIIDGSDFNQWVWWDSLGYGDLPYDVVITNQLVASLEISDVAMHTALRGGINGGTMTYSKHGRYGGYVFVSVFALINDLPLLTQLRDDKHYTAEQIIHYAAATLAHELGHLFMHYDHPFGAKDCIMNPTPLLHYRTWYNGLNADSCRAISLPQMQRGAAKIGYNADW